MKHLQKSDTWVIHRREENEKAIRKIPKELPIHATINKHIKY